MISPDRLTQIKAREQAATKGPWTHDQREDDENHAVELVVYPDGEDVSLLTIPDAEFIAHARQDIPDLVAEVDRLTTENNELKRVERVEKIRACDALILSRDENLRLRAALTSIAEMSTVPDDATYHIANVAREALKGGE